MKHLKDYRDREVEYEFGVPIPGRILPPEQWVKTAIKRLPPPGPIDWSAVFGREAPLVLDIGCGNGRFTLASALRRPELNHIGLDILPVVIRYATRRANQRGLSNVRFIVCGGHEFLENYVIPHSVAEIHVYHPQPYKDPEKQHRRLLTPAFLALVHRSLVPGGLFVLQTDNPAYWRYVRPLVDHFFHFQDQEGPWPDMPEGRTRREIYARLKGLPIFRGYGYARQDITDDQARALATTLPPPVFSAEEDRDPLKKGHPRKPHRPKPRGTGRTRRR
ncbi:tRNA (guanine(46)-N(7))-methyltransferase TrmB [Thermogutta sp.]|uniref:tRNA (guanine(46)-N(7))-methyltransferase TrmB n=1 Tax=Thermogutta sp. TaxID=1962930 RepID=UPI0032203019